MEGERDHCEKHHCLGNFVMQGESRGLMKKSGVCQGMEWLQARETSNRSSSTRDHALEENQLSTCTIHAMSRVEDIDALLREDAFDEGLSSTVPFIK